MTDKFLFPMRNNIYLIPSWMTMSLHRRGMKAADILDFSKMRPVFALGDLIALQVLQSFGGNITGTNRVSLGHSLEFPWSKTCATEEDRKFLREQLTPLFGDPHHRQVLVERLFSEGDTASSEKPYEVVPLGDEALGIVLYPGNFSPAGAARLQFSVIRDVLKQLYVYEEHTAVAASELSLRYLELLQQRK